MKNRIKKFLEKFNIEHKQFGDRDDDAIEVVYDGVSILISGFDNDIEICIVTITDLENRKSLSTITTYEDIILEMLDKFVNHKD